MEHEHLEQGRVEPRRTLQSLSDDELLRRLGDLLRQSRRTEADLVAHIAEVDERRLYARFASPSMFAYCTEVLHLSEAEAYLRIAAAPGLTRAPDPARDAGARAAALSGLAKLAPHLTSENRDAVLAQAAGKSKRDIEELVAELAPRPDAPALIRRLPERPRPASPPAARPVGELRPDAVAVTPLALAGAAIVEPTAPARYKVQFTASAEFRDKLERLQALMRSAVPDGDLAAIIEDAITEKLQRLEARRFGLARKPRTAPLEGREVAQGRENAAWPSSRHIPAAIRRAVRERDGNRCRYVDEEGRRCTARDRLEFHHRQPYGHGGGHTIENVSLVCRAHNGYLAETDYGRRGVRRSPARPAKKELSAPVASTS